MSVLCSEVFLVEWAIIIRYIDVVEGKKASLLSSTNLSSLLTFYWCDNGCGISRSKTKVIWEFRCLCRGWFQIFKDQCGSVPSIPVAVFGLVLKCTFIRYVSNVSLPVLRCCVILLNHTFYTTNF